MIYWGYRITDESYLTFKRFMMEMNAFRCGLTGEPFRMITDIDMLHFLEDRIDGYLEPEDDSFRLFALDGKASRVALASTRRGPEIRAELEKMLRRATFFSKLCLEEVELDFRPASPCGPEEQVLLPRKAAETQIVVSS
jgi:hypothetical protein